MNTLLCLTLAAVCCTSLVLGQSQTICTSDSDCSSLKGSNCRIVAPCKKGYCFCPPGQGPSGGSCQNVNAPKSKANLGAACTADNDCGAGARCSSSKCTCMDNVIAMSDNVNCGGYSKDATCSGSNVCGSIEINGDCSSGKCACKSGYTWATGGDIGQPGGCVDSKATLNLAQGQVCSYTGDKYCGANLHCMSCPEGGSPVCLSGSASLTVAVATIVMAAVCGLLLGRL